VRSFLRELFFPLNPSQRKNFFVLILLSFVSMFFIVASVGAILPIVAIIVSDDLYEKYSWAGQIENLVGIESRQHFLLAAVSGFFLLIFLKVVIGLWVLLKQKKLNANIRVSVTDRLFRRLISMPYSFHVSENSGKLLRNLTSDINAHARSIESTIVILSEGTMTLGLVALLASVDPIGLAIIAVLVSGAAFAYLRVVQPKLSRWGKLFREESGAMMVHTQQALGGIKEIKILRRERFFEDIFRNSVKKMLDFQRKFSVIQAVPVNILELLIALGVVLIVLGVAIRGAELSELAPVLALFMASAVRLGPSLSRIAGAIQGIRYDRPAMNALYLCLKDNFGTDRDSTNLKINADSKKEEDEELPQWSVLSLKGVSFSYPMRKGFSLDEINLTIKKGSALGIFGESGSGKTTLMDILLGLNQDYSGDVSIDGKSLRDCVKSWQAQIGYVPQSVFLIDDTLRRNIALGVRDGDIDEEKIKRAVQKAQLKSFVDSLEEGLDSIVGERGARISGGQQQRVGIARALYRDPSILIFDEATSALDSKTEAEFMETVAQMQGAVTMIIIAHRLTTLRVCDELIQMREGRIFAHGSYEELIHAT